VHGLSVRIQWSLLLYLIEGLLFTKNTFCSKHAEVFCYYLSGLGFAMMFKKKVRMYPGSFDIGSVLSVFAMIKVSGKGRDCIPEGN